MSVAIDYSSGAFAANKAQGVGTIAQAQAGYDLANASYDSVSFSVASQTLLPYDLFIDSTGSHLYVVSSNDQNVYQYSLSSTWDITSASYVRTLDVSTNSSGPRAIFFKPDGSEMYLGVGGDQEIQKYSLSSNWDISSATYTNALGVSSQGTSPSGLYIGNSGTKLYFSTPDNNLIVEYTLSTAWDITSATHVQSLDINTHETAVQAVVFKPDGTSMYIIGSQRDAIKEFSLSTAWDLSTASKVGAFADDFVIASQETSPQGIFFKSDGTKLYVVGTANDTIYQYSTGSYVQNLDISSGTYFNYTPSANTTFTFSNAPASGTAAGFALAVTGANVGAGYDIANASYDNKSFDISSQETLASALFFKPDGTKMYMTGGNADSVFEYDLSTAFDVSTAAYNSASYYYGAPPGITEALFFRADGLKWYSIDRGEDRVYEYNMSTAWDITSSSLNQSLDVSNKEAAGRGLFFNSDGTKMYICGTGLSTANQYNLSTAWDISTASHSSTFSVSSQDVFPQGISIKSDGTKMYIVGSNTDTVYQYSLSTAYDLSTASYDSVSFSVQSQDSLPFGFYLKPDGTKMYIAGRSNDTIFQYTTQSTATSTFTYPSSVKFPSGTAPAGPAIGETDVLVFYTDDGGTTYQGFRAGDAMA
jgi:DNA-binding beta-propeller fold protein YncE